MVCREIIKVNVVVCLFVVQLFKGASAITILNNDKIYQLLNERGLGDVGPETAEAVESILGELDRKNVLKKIIARIILLTVPHLKPHLS